MPSAAEVSNKRNSLRKVNAEGLGNKSEEKSEEKAIFGPGILKPWKNEENTTENKKPEEKMENSAFGPGLLRKTASKTANQKEEEESGENTLFRVPKMEGANMRTSQRKQDPKLESEKNRNFRGKIVKEICPKQQT